MLQQTLFVLILLLICLWTAFWGLLSAGDMPTLSWLVLIGIPLALCWVSYGALRYCRRSPTWTLVAVVAVSLLTYPLIKQPWSPRHVFVSTLTALPPGMSVAEVRRRMARYIEGDLIESKIEFQPNDLRSRGITHQMPFHWNLTEGRYDADVGWVYFRDGAVVGTEFSAD